VLAALRNRLGALVSRHGRPVRCEACGQVLFRSLPYASRGQVKLPGADIARVRVDFETTTRLGFRHAELSRCRRPDGPPQAAR
jgi:hypothetical protein